MTVNLTLPSRTERIFPADDVDYFGLASGDQTTFTGLTASTGYHAWAQ